MNGWSLKWQILALVLAAVVVVVLSLTVLTISQMNNQLHASLERKAVGISSLLAENLSPGLEFADSAFINTVASSAFVDQDIVGVGLYDNQKRRVFESASEAGVLSVIDTCNQVPSLSVDHIGDYCYVERPVVSQGKIVGCLWLVVTEEAMLAQLYRGTAATIALAVTLLVLTAIVGVVMARRLTRPIRTFSRAAGRISSGDMLATVDVSRLQQDFVPLGAAFNSMQAALSQAFGELKDSRDKLESQVEERTRDLRNELSERKKVELALAEGRELLRATLESTVDGILVVDSRGVTTHNNRRFVDMWHIPDELLKTREDNRLLAYVLDQLVDPQAFLDKVRELYASRDESMDTLHFLDGRVFERFSCPLMKDDKPVGRVWSFRDVSDRVRAMEKLRLTQFSIDHVADPAFWMREDGALFYVNEAACRMLGYSQQELLQMKFQDVDPNFPTEAWPMQWRQLKQRGSLNFRSSHRCKNGREYSVEIAADYVDFQGQEYICAFSRDITERRRSEQAQAVLLRVAEAANQVTVLEDLLRTVHTQVNALIDAANFFVALWDEEKQVYTFPYARDEHKNEDFSPQRLEFSLTDFVRRHNQPLLVDEPTHRRLTANGEAGVVGYPSLAWMGIPLRATSGTIGVLVVQSYHNAHAYSEADLDWLTSVAEPVARVMERVRADEQQRLLREELERSERMRSLGVLAGGVAHDLNNMLGPLVGYPELILMRLPEESPIRKQIQRIGAAAKEAAMVVQDLLTLARRGRYEMVPTDINAVVDAYLDTPGFAKLTETKPDVIVSTSLDRKIGHITGSSPHLSKVIMNLIVNAFDAMPNGGTLQIDTRQQHVERLYNGYDKLEPGQYIVLTVKDSGTGIDPTDIEKIFEPYYSKKTMGTSGSGLGLSVVYGVVKDHKGYYDVISQLGKGTAFVLYFPVSGAAAENRPQATIDIKGTETVLVVDDDDNQREMAAELLGTCGYTVSLAAHGHEALRFLAENSADIVVMDMIMEKEFDGLDTYREIIKTKPRQKAIIVSGYSTTERVQEMQSLGAGQYVRKPYTRQSLATAIRNELNRPAGAELVETSQIKIPT